MSLSIRDLKNLLDSKGSTSGTLTDDLQGLKSYLALAFNARANTLPADIGQSRSGKICTGHLGSGAPPLTNVSHSLGDINDWQNSYLVNQTCNGHLITQSFCAARITCPCNTQHVVTCLSRIMCACRSEQQVNCGSRTACACNEGGTVGACAHACANNNQGSCSCFTRYGVCHCRDRVDCSGRYVCACNTQATTVCRDRIACECNTRADADCLSRATCTCHARCSCNVVDVFG